jgi:hypothetical protein
MKAKIIFLPVVVFFVSCLQNPIPDDPVKYFNHAETISPQIIGTDKSILFGARMEIVNDTVLAICNTNSKDNQLILVNIQSGKVLKELIHRGRGVGELTSMAFCPTADRDKLWIFDPNLKTIFNVDWKRAVSDVKYLIEPIAVLPEIGVYFGIDTTFIASMVYSNNNRFQILNSQGKLIKSCLSYPKPEHYRDIPDHVYATGLQGFYTVKPDNRKFAFAATTAGGIQFFNYNPDSISMTANLNFYDPIFSVDQGVCVISRESKIAFIDISCNENYVYMLYSGMPMMKYAETQTCKHLLVFDWNGNPIKRYELEEELAAFKVNSSGDKMYGIAYMPETTIVQYDLK